MARSQVTKYLRYYKKYIHISSAYVKMSNPIENLKEKIFKIVGLKLPKSKINKINKIIRIRIKKKKS